MNEKLDALAAEYDKGGMSDRAYLAAITAAMSEGEYERKNGDTSRAPKPKNESYEPCYDTVGMCSLCAMAA